MRKFTIAAAAALAMSGAAAAQQAPVSNPTQPISTFSAATVGAVLDELGAVWQAQQVGDQTFIAANAGGQVSFMLVPAACRGANQSQCVGLSMIAIFEGQANPQTVTAFNYRYAFASAGLDPSGAAYIKRYEISDFGMARGNLATSILVFVEQAKMLQAELSTARRTVAYQGYADDMSADALNRRAFEEQFGVRAHGTTPVEVHQIGIDESAELVKLFINNKQTPRNKIENVRK